MQQGVLVQRHVRVEGEGCHEGRHRLRCGPAQGEAQACEWQSCLASASLGFEACVAYGEGKVGPV